VTVAEQSMFDTSPSTWVWLPPRICAVVSGHAASRSWLRAHGAVGEELDDVRRVRDDLQRVVRGERGPAVLDDRDRRAVTPLLG
jgi:hypothetical protein